MEFLIISGLSGAGKSRAADILEDLDYYCVDNMPIALIPKFAQICLAAGERYEKVALVTDIRERANFDELFEVLDGLWDLGCDYRIIFVEADPDIIVKRYKETRRRHPLTVPGSTVEDAIMSEIKLLEPVRERADYIINTSNLTLGMLQSEIFRLFVGGDSKRKIVVNIMSFGYKYGIPLESDLVFDVRFLPNPFYVSELREQNGLDEAVSRFVMQNEMTKEFFAKLQDITKFLLPLYVEEGKMSLSISIGCTGGHHRSVAIAKALTDYIEGLGYAAQNINRDIQK
ncbi:MAG: RNase adapter RapZ [Firmicutes bacterium HGW-Firmicutes-16]|nr:MAG: RNase adapter RapZ [Firmicutes bacterium HGW-Firmicutes-16]